MFAREYKTTVFVSSHILSEIESMADTIGIISHGVMKQEISMQEIREENDICTEFVTPDVRHAAYVLEQVAGVKNFKILEEGKIRIYEKKELPSLSQILVENKIGIQALTNHSETLEEYFLKLTGEEK